ncbi:hypothetical protein [Lactococcus kimchii]|uniref:hypothetical protein n=1 Tax=Lactococcus sp. S-13 TaxID=2507158 RepID=UPI0010234517|nr:hypothetical protein [Lactococcus sp. S-13]
MIAQIQPADEQNFIFVSSFSVAVAKISVASAIFLSLPPESQLRQQFLCRCRQNLSCVSNFSVAAAKISVASVNSPLPH